MVVFVVRTQRTDEELCVMFQVLAGQPLLVPAILLWGRRASLAQTLLRCSHESNSYYICHTGDHLAYQPGRDEIDLASSLLLIL